MEQNNPLISIITVSYNAASTIAKTILSVINQTYPNMLIGKVRWDSNV